MEDNKPKRSLEEVQKLLEQSTQKFNEAEKYIFDKEPPKKKEAE